jgi:pimeloyl-ACP methyl ester carboxylesterase
MSRAAMRPLARDLLARGAIDRAVLVDLRGHGDTRAPASDDSHSYPAMRDDVIALIEAEGGSPAHLIGHSMGGQIALLVALSRPALVRSLALFGAGPCRAVDDERERRRWLRAADAFEQSRPRDLASSLASAAPTRRTALTPELLYGSARGADLARIVRGGFLALESNDEDCRWLDVPTLLVAGDEDAGWLTPTRRLAELVPGSELRIAGDAGHLVHFEEPERCAQWIAAHARAATLTRRP